MRRRRPASTWSSPPTPRRTSGPRTTCGCRWCRRRAAEAQAPIVYCNQVGGQDELVFDGDSLVVSADGELLARAPQFVEHLLTVDLALDAAAVADRREGRIGPMTVTRHLVSDEPVPPFEPRPGTVVEPLSDCEEVWRALVLGLRDFIDKNGMPSVVLGMSGGIDSALVAALAVDALGADRVYGVGLPSKWSSEHSLSDAEDSAKRLGMHYSVVPIAPMVEAFEASVELSGVAAENLQARVRGTLLMGLSNQHGHLLLATSNKSEVAVGYSTLYGDAAGGFAPIKDVPKTLVWELARWRNAEARRARRDRADPAELDRQAAVGRAGARPAGQRLAALLRGARRRHRRLRRPRPRDGRAARARARRRGGRPGPPAGRHRRVQAPPVGARARRSA